MAAHSFPLDARLVGALCGVAAFWAPHGLGAQEGCALGEGSQLYVQEALPGGGTISYFTAPHFECEDDVEIWADSAVAYSELGMSLLMGAVRYLDRTRELRADTARYFTDQGRLQAAGHVFIQDEEEGSQVENGELVYLRQTSFRAVETMTVTTGLDGLRPRALIVPAPPDSAPPAARPPRPYSVVGDRIYLEGDSYFAAAGTVEIEQDSLLAFADSAEYDEAGANLVLEGSARVVSKGNELVGRSITVATPGAEASRITARKDAVLTGDGILLTAPQILLFLMDGSLERLVAVPLPAGEDDLPSDTAAVTRPVATLENAELTGDSLDISAPNEIVERVVAVGGARSVSAARDSLNTETLPDVARTDWLEGDTVIVTFRSAGARPAAVADSILGGDSMPDSITMPDSMTGADSMPDSIAVADMTADSITMPDSMTVADLMAVADSVAGGDFAAPPVLVSGDGGRGEDNEIESVVAKGRARALYRLVPSDSMARVGIDPPALHYVVGDEITIRMTDGDVDGMRVVGQTRGVHLEPLAPRPVTDSIADTTAVAIDTAAARTDTTSTRRPERGPRPRLERPDTREQRSPLQREEPWRRE